jgi:hypothetical protein
MGHTKNGLAALFSQLVGIATGRPRINYVGYNLNLVGTK